MIVPGFLAELRKRDIEIRADGDRLLCAAPAGALTPELRDELQQRKGEILAFLRGAEALALQQRAIVPLEPRGARTPVFAVAGHNGDVFCYRALARYLGEEQPFFGLQPPGLDERSEPVTRVEDLAAYFADQIRAFRPNGPYIITGFCAGGTIAFELARQLMQGGARIGFVGLFGSPDPTWYRWPTQLAWRVAQQAARLSQHARAVGSLSPLELGRYIAGRVEGHKARREIQDAARFDPVLVRRSAVERATVAAVRRYRPGRFTGRVGLFLPSQEWLPSAARRWHSLAPRAEAYVGPAGCNNDTMLLDPYAAGFADLFRRCREGMAPIPPRKSDPRLPLPLLAVRRAD